MCDDITGVKGAAQSTRVRRYQGHREFSNGNFWEFPGSHCFQMSVGIPGNFLLSTFLIFGRYNLTIEMNEQFKINFIA